MLKLPDMGMLRLAADDRSGELLTLAAVLKAAEAAAGSAPEQGGVAESICFSSGRSSALKHGMQHAGVASATACNLPGRAWLMLAAAAVDRSSGLMALASSSGHCIVLCCPLHVPGWLCADLQMHGGAPAQQSAAL